MKINKKLLRILTSVLVICALSVGTFGLSPSSSAMAAEVTNQELTIVPNANVDGLINIPYRVGSDYNWQACSTDGSGYVYAGYAYSYAWYTDLYQLGNHGSESGVINSVTVNIKVSRVVYETYTGYARTEIRIGGTITDGEEHEIPSVGSGAIFSHTYDTVPGTVDNWTWDNIDDLQAGVSLYGQNIAVNCDYVWVVVNYTPAATAPSVTTHPSDQTVTEGQNASFSAAASGNPTPTVQWQISTDSGSTWSDISGAILGTYTTAATTLAMNGYQYQAVFHNSQGDATSNPATLTVNAAIITYTVTFNSQGGSPTPLSQDVAEDGLVQEPVSAPELTDYTFDGWYKNIECTDNWDFDVDTVTADVTLFARWTPVTYATVIDQSQETASYWQAINQGEALYTASGQTFTVGTTGQCGKVSAYLMVPGSPPADVTAELRTVTDGLPSSTVLATATGTVTSALGEWVDFTFSLPPVLSSGTQYALVLTGPTNVTFWNYSQSESYTTGSMVFYNGSWYEATSGNDYVFRTYVRVPATAHTVTFNLGGHGTLVSGDLVQTVIDGEAAIAPTFTVGTGWTFTGWDNDFSNVTADLTVTAQYSQTYTVTFVLGEHGALASGNLVQTVIDGEAAVAPTLDVEPGWTFTGWDTDFSNVTANLTVTAQYSPETSHVATVTSSTYTVSAGGTNTETITNVPYGTAKTTFLLNLSKGEANQTWDSTSIHDPVVTNDTLVVTAQDGTTHVTYTISVNAAPATYTVTYNGNGNTGGTPPTDINTYDAGTSVTVLGPGDLTKAEYIFAGWTMNVNGKGTLYDSGDTFTITKNVTFYAKWNPVYNTTVTLSGTKSARAGQKVTITATVDAVGGKINPTGTVTFYCSESPGVQGSALSSGTDIPLVRGKASYTTTTLESGHDYYITAVFSDAGGFNTSTSNQWKVTIK